MNYALKQSLSVYQSIKKQILFSNIHLKSGALCYKLQLVHELGTIDVDINEYYL